MTFNKAVLAGAAMLAGGVALSTPGSAAGLPGNGVTIYMQMGGNAGDGSTLARTNGAEAAAHALGVAKLNEQYAGWAPETMISQFRQALAARPSCIVIMGHPGADAFHDLVRQATSQGIVVTDGNSPLTALQQEFGPRGFGYSGVDL